MSYLILCLSLHRREGGLECSNFRCGGVVAATTKQVVLRIYFISGSVILGGGELVGIFAEGSALAGQEVVFSSASGLDGLSLTCTK